jgi:hypothetical protein
VIHNKIGTESDFFPVPENTVAELDVLKVHEISLVEALRRSSQINGHARARDPRRLTGGTITASMGFGTTLCTSSAN